MSLKKLKQTIKNILSTIGPAIVIVGFGCGWGYSLSHTIILDRKVQELYENQKIIAEYVVRLVVQQQHTQDSNNGVTNDQY
jgi:hypothetical protein